MAFNQNPWCLAPGRLRQRVSIQAATTPTDGEAGPTYATWLRNVPAEVIEAGGAMAGGGERVRGRMIEAGLSAVVTIRYRDDISPTMRLVYGTRYLNIVSVTDPTGYRMETVLTCKELDA